MELCSDLRFGMYNKKPVLSWCIPNVNSFDISAIFMQAQNIGLELRRNKSRTIKK